MKFVMKEWRGFLQELNPSPADGGIPIPADTSDTSENPQPQPTTPSAAAPMTRDEEQRIIDDSMKRLTGRITRRNAIQTRAYIKAVELIRKYCKNKDVLLMLDLSYSRPDIIKIFYSRKLLTAAAANWPETPTAVERFTRRLRAALGNAEEPRLQSGDAIKIAIGTKDLMAIAVEIHEMFIDLLDFDILESQRENKYLEFITLMKAIDLSGTLVHELAHAAHYVGLGPPEYDHDAPSRPFGSLPQRAATHEPFATKIEIEYLKKVYFGLNKFLFEGSHYKGGKVSGFMGYFIKEGPSGQFQDLYLRLAKDYFKAVMVDHLQNALAYGHSHDSVLPKPLRQNVKRTDVFSNKGSKKWSPEKGGWYWDPGEYKIKK